MIKSPLFEQFVEAVRSKGFFRDPDTEGQRDDPDEELIRQQRAQRNLRGQIPEGSRQVPHKTCIKDAE
jgi:hypothetical protein